MSPVHDCMIVSHCEASSSIVSYSMFQYDSGILCNRGFSTVRVSNTGDVSSSSISCFGQPSPLGLLCVVPSKLSSSGLAGSENCVVLSVLSARLPEVMTPAVKAASFRVTSLKWRHDKTRNHIFLHH